MQANTLTLPPSATKFESLLDILLEPQRCFAAIRQHQSWFALPLGLMLLLMALYVSKLWPVLVLLVVYDIVRRARQRGTKRREASA